MKTRLSSGLILLALFARVAKEYGAAAYIFLTVGFALAGFAAFHSIDQNANRIGSNETRLEHLVASHRRALYGSCGRVNTLRRNGNRANVQRYKDDMLAAKLLARRPEARRAFSARARRIRWIPLTDCTSAVDKPQQFKAPTPRFVWRTPTSRIPR